MEFRFDMDVLIVRHTQFAVLLLPLLLPLLLLLLLLLVLLLPLPMMCLSGPASESLGVDDRPQNGSDHLKSY